jgi:hypothetical protein
MAANSRHTYPLAELARIRPGMRTIASIHNNWCPALTGTAKCTCGNMLEYRMVMRKMEVDNAKHGVETNNG